MTDIQAVKRGILSTVATHPRSIPFIAKTLKADPGVVRAAMAQLETERRARVYRTFRFEGGTTISFWATATRDDQTVRGFYVI